MTDISELPAAGRKYYLSPVIDCYDGLPVYWGPSSSVVHTDGGGPYRTASWKGVCSRRGVTRSMSRPGRCGDNARAEGFFGALKVEFLYSAFSQVKVDSSLCRFPTLRSGHARAPSFRYQRA